MAVFNDSTREQIKGILKACKNDVHIIYFSQEFECPTCQSANMFLEEITGLNDKLHLKKYDFVKDADYAKELGVDKIPAIVLLDNEKEDKGVKFFGIPAGYEINSFVSSLIEVSGSIDMPSRDLVERIKKIDKKIDIQVFIGLGCPHCPGAVINAHKLALLNENVNGSMVESATFPYLANKYSVQSVPKIVINEKHSILGNQPLDEILNLIDSI